MLSGGMDDVATSDLTIARAAPITTARPSMTLPRRMNAEFLTSALGSGLYGWGGGPLATFLVILSAREGP